MSGEGKGVVKGAAILQWVMTVAGFLLLAGVIFWEVFLLLNGLPTDIIQVWPLLVIGALLFAGGCSCFLTKAAPSAESPRPFGESPRDL